MRVFLVIPWRETPDRLEAFQVVMSTVPTFYEFTAVVTVDSGHPRFNRSASRNLGVTVAEEAGADVIVVNDADSVPEALPLKNAIFSAEDGLMNFPFTEAWYVDYKGMMRVRQLATPLQVKNRIWDKCESEGGSWVCTPETWWKAGGQDPLLANWGCDDRAFLAASRTLVGMPVKHDGVLYCLPHTRPGDEEIWVPEEVEGLLEYENAYLQPEKMKQVIDARANLSRSVAKTSEECSPVVRVLQGDVHL